MLGAEAAALILDDTAGVWPRHSGNLLQPRRYIYFPADHARWGGYHGCAWSSGFRIWRQDIALTADAVHFSYAW